MDTPDVNLYNQDAIPSDESEHSDETNPELEVPEPGVQDQSDANQPEEDKKNHPQPAEITRHSSYPLRVLEPKRQWEESSHQSILQQHDDEPEPTRLSDAMNSNNVHLWKTAAEDEYDSPNKKNLDDSSASPWQVIHQIQMGFYNPTRRSWRKSQIQGQTCGKGERKSEKGGTYQGTASTVVSLQTIKTRTYISICLLKTLSPMTV